jgi:hypothetical protein
MTNNPMNKQLINVPFADDYQNLWKICQGVDHTKGNNQSVQNNLFKHLNYVCQASKQSCSYLSNTFDELYNKSLVQDAADFIDIFSQ